MEKNQETKKENSDFQESVPSQTGRVLSHPLALQVRRLILLVISNLWTQCFLQVQKVWKG